MGLTSKSSFYTSPLAVTVYDYRKKVNVHRKSVERRDICSSEDKFWFSIRRLQDFAEKVAWEFIAKEKPSFTLTTVNPVYVFGPWLWLSTMTLWISSLLPRVISPKVLKTKKNESVFEAKGTGVDVGEMWWHYTLLR